MSTENSPDGIRRETIGIRGMRCKSCSDSIESRIKAMDGIRDIKVDLIGNSATVEYDPSVTGSEKIRSEIGSLGYVAEGADRNSAGPSMKRNYMEGVIYGLVPHIGCIAFIIASILGVTVLMNAFKPLLMNRYFFHILILISVGFATVSSAVYLRKNGLLSAAGARRKWQYLSTMYGSTLGINLLLFFLIFPMLANVTAAVPSVTGGIIGIPGGGTGSTIRLGVDIPCPGHAPLITGELKSLSGVSGVQFSFPNVFDVTYDPAKTSKGAMLALDVFKEYPAKVISEGAGLATAQSSPVPAASGKAAGGCGCGGCASGGCGGSGLN